MEYKSVLIQAFGKELRKRRNTFGMSSDEVADNMQLQHSYYRAVEAGTFNLHSSNSKNLSNVMQWERLSVCIILQIIGEIKISAGKCNTIKSAQKVEDSIREDWLSLYPKFTFLQKEIDVETALPFFLLHGFQNLTSENRVVNFLQQNPEFLQRLNEFGKLLGI